MRQVYPFLQKNYKLLIVFVTICSMNLYLGFNFRADSIVQVKLKKLEKTYYRGQVEFSSVFMSNCNAFLDSASEERVAIDTYFRQQQSRIKFIEKNLIQIDDLTFNHLTVSVGSLEDPTLEISKNGFYVVNTNNNKCFGLI